MKFHNIELLTIYMCDCGIILEHLCEIIRNYFQQVGVLYTKYSLNNILFLFIYHLYAHLFL